MGSGWKVPGQVITVSIRFLSLPAPVPVPAVPTEGELAHERPHTTGGTQTFPGDRAHRAEGCQDGAEKKGDCDQAR